MEKAKIRPIATPKPLNQFSQKLAGVITSWMPPGVQLFVAVGSGVSVPQIRDFAVLLGWLVFSLFFGGSSIRLQPTPLNGFLRKIRQMTLFRVRKCLLKVPMTIFLFRPLNVRKTAILGTDFDWTENRFNIGMLWTTLNRHCSPKKSCIVNRQFGVKILLRVVLGDLLCTGHVIVRTRSKLCSFHSGKRYFSPIAWFNLRRSALKVIEWIGKLGSGISKMWTIFAPG